jgi:hypothetical protein
MVEMKQLVVACGMAHYVVCPIMGLNINLKDYIFIHVSLLLAYVNSSSFKNLCDGSTFLLHL